METDKIKEVNDFADKLEKAQQFNLFTHRYRKDSFAAELSFAGYNDLMLTVMDIMRVCMSALDGEEHLTQTSMSASSMNISNVLAIAVQLIPLEETQILDECFQLHLKLKEKSE